MRHPKGYEIAIDQRGFVAALTRMSSLYVVIFIVILMGVLTLLIESPSFENILMFAPHLILISPGLFIYHKLEKTLMEIPFYGIGFRLYYTCLYYHLLTGIVFVLLVVSFPSVFQTHHNVRYTYLIYSVYFGVISGFTYFAKYCCVGAAS